ncbi:MAG TPA: hypothetical protein VHP33_28055 [Polyangiaceae bacterium]|nr:hypothetical protein [Polyangiaceae bacterium]
MDRLEVYTKALQQAHAHYRMTVEPADHLQDLVEHGTTLRKQLLADAHALILRGHLQRNALQNLKTRPGSTSLASDLLTLAQLFRAHWPALAHKCTPESDLALAEHLGANLLHVVGRRQFTHAIAVAAQLRLRTFTLFIRTYDDLRRAVTYLCGRETDPNRIAPSLYGGRKRRKRKQEGGLPSTGAEAAPETRYA